jgi:putative flippase GtrA
MKLPFLNNKLLGKYSAKDAHIFAVLVRYIISGGTASAVDLGIIYFLTETVKIWYLFSSILGFFVAFIVSFLLQKHWTFRDTRKNGAGKQALSYFAISIANLALNTTLLYILVDVFHLWYMLAQFITLGLIAISSFFLYKLFIFNTAE